MAWLMHPMARAHRRGARLRGSGYCADEGGLAGMQGLGRGVCPWGPGVVCACAWCVHTRLVRMGDEGGVGFLVGSGAPAERRRQRLPR